MWETKNDEFMYYHTGQGLRAAKYPPIWLLNYLFVKCLSFVHSLDWTTETRAVLTFMSQPKDVKNAKFCAESNGCVRGFWNGLNGVSISAILVMLYLIVYCPALMPRRPLSPDQYSRFLRFWCRPKTWWVGEKNCVIDGNAIRRWLSIVVERAKKTMRG